MGTAPKQSSIRTLNQDGSFNTGRRRSNFFHDSYHELLSASWPKFLFLVLSTYFLVNLVFAILYFFCNPESFEGMRTTSREVHFSDCFFFSIQTLATIGYGRISPVQLLPNLIVSIEALVSLMGLALVTGLFFTRFSRPTARVIFSKNAVITKYDGKDVLMFRMANERLNHIVEAHVDVALAHIIVQPDGERFRNLTDLKLKRRKSPLFASTWTVMHFIEPDSPLYQKSKEDLEKCEAEILVSLSGLDETFAQTIHARYSYTADDLVWNKKFEDILVRDANGQISVNLKKMHELKAS
ncbi:MAG: channel inward rectifier conserved region 2 domain protein [Bacteriovoracaceae bacterium]|nr:channel inward rectifier conserved region 2 domain protein [Bacteriovoracaceae bacterium]